MSSLENIRTQIEDLEKKISRLQTQKFLLEERLKRKEEHSLRIESQNQNDQRAREIGIHSQGLRTDSNNLTRTSYFNQPK